MSRGRLLVVLALVTPLGLATKTTGAGLVRAYAGGALYVVFWTLVVLVVRPALAPAKAAAAVFAATAAVECLQLWHPPFLERVRATLLGHALLGSTFSPWDFAAYAVGAGLAVAAAAACRSRA